MLVPKKIEFNNMILSRSDISMASYLYLWYLEYSLKIVEKDYLNAEQKLVSEGIIDDVIEFCNQRIFRYWKSPFWYRNRSITDFYFEFEAFFKHGHTATYKMKPFSDEQVFQAFTFVINFMLKEMNSNRGYLKTICKCRDVTIKRSESNIY